MTGGDNLNFWTISFAILALVAFASRAEIARRSTSCGHCETGREPPGDRNGDVYWTSSADR